MEHRLYELFQRTAAPFEVEITPELAERFDRYRVLLQDWNTRMNLTAITDDEGIIVKHFADSLSLVPLIKALGRQNGSLSLADVGTGAGFPGIPLKLAMPELRVCLIDSLAKRLTFLNEVISQLSLSGIETVHARAEDAGRDKMYRDRFDIVSARAVASMPVLLEYCMPLVKPGGTFFAMKGSLRETDFDTALRELSSELEKEVSFSIAGEDGETAARIIYCVKKCGRTNAKYPRKAGTASKNPIR